MLHRLKQLYYAFPVQLLLLHIRSNLLLLVLWVLLALMMSGYLGQKLGVQYLFLDPEYIGEVNFLSFYIIGLALGGFFMSWNLTTYLLTTQHFPFLASLTRPFTKFSINNLLLPAFFGLFYLLLIGYFQREYQELSVGRILWHLLALLLGSFTLIMGYVAYFVFTNRDISYYVRAERVPPNLRHLFVTPGSRKADLDYLKLDRNRIPVWTYLNEKFQPRLVRSVAHYESRLLLNIFKQNHLNALALQLISMIVLLLLGYLVDWPIFRLPAGASVMILFSLLTALVGALTYWFSEWRTFVMILLLVGINHLTSSGTFKRVSEAYGLDYERQEHPYNYAALHQLCGSDRVAQDRDSTEAILARRMARVGQAKPKLVIVCASGGGLKAAVWSMHVLQQADRATKGRLLDQSVLMTGASGGMLGMAYLRELYGRYPRQQLYSTEYVDQMGQDILNSVAFTLVSNDLFIPYRTFTYAGQRYYHDRGTMMEQQLDENTGGVLHKSLAAYQQPEASGELPLLYLTPAIINDGRQMVISPQGVSFMMLPPVGFDYPNTFETDAVDFRWLLGNHQADSLSFLTALRMNATYPYILPTVHLPTDPPIALADAGFRDNYGLQTATRFIQVFQDWITDHTSGVVVVQINSTDKIEETPPSSGTGMIESLFNPLGIAGKVLDVQELQHDNTLSYVYDLLGPGRFDLIRFNYHPSNDKQLEASVSLHLTAQEKEDVLEAIKLPENRAALRRLQALLE